jgi:CheY-like chemotaxis protein
MALADSLPPIFVVDDDPHDRFLLLHRLEEAEVGNPIREFRDGDEFIEFLDLSYATEAREVVPCLVITDIKMPRARGFDVIQWIRRHPVLASVPIFALSGSNLAEDRARALELGANAYLEKFPPPDELRRLMTTVVERFVAAGLPANTGLRRE